jgi:hypothetical protein
MRRKHSKHPLHILGYLFEPCIEMWQILFISLKKIVYLFQKMIEFTTQISIFTTKKKKNANLVIEYV